MADVNLYVDLYSDGCVHLVDDSHMCSYMAFPVDTHRPGPARGGCVAGMRLLGQASAVWSPTDSSAHPHVCAACIDSPPSHNSINQSNFPVGSGLFLSSDA